MDGNQRYSWTKKKRSPLVSRTLPRLFRCNTISCCRSVAISAPSRAFDLNGETKMARTNQRSPITRSAYAIRPPPQRAEVFGTHRSRITYPEEPAISKVGQRYSWTKNKRSLLVSRTLPRLFRRSTISCCRSVAFFASSRDFDLNGE